MLSELREQVKNINLGDKEPLKEVLKPILSNDKIFAVDLYKVRLGEQIEGMFVELIAEKGSVRAILQKYLK